MYMIVEVSQYVAVASFLEAWIEITNYDYINKLSRSPPSWRRGLKFKGAERMIKNGSVASFLEAWIEIPGHLIMAVF